jgi:hypothetical protein
MDHSEFAEVKKRLVEINKVIESLDPSIRASAFEILRPHLLPNVDGAPPKIGRNGDGGSGAMKSDRKPEDQAEFFSSREKADARPKDNVHLIAAWLYSQYGLHAITAKDVKGCADDIGITIPDRSDNTMRTAKEDGNLLYRQKGKGWQLTVKGEAYFEVDPKNGTRS